MKSRKLDSMLGRTRQSTGKSRRANLLDLARYCEANPREVNALTDDDRRGLSDMLNEVVPAEVPKTKAPPKRRRAAKLTVAHACEHPLTARKTRTVGRALWAYCSLCDKNLWCIVEEHITAMRHASEHRARGESIWAGK